jgi:hypothetical protein
LWEKRISSQIHPLSFPFSNPILLRDSDPLMATRKKNRHKRQQQLLRQQSIARIQHLGGAISISQRSSPSVNTDLGDDGGETSSIGGDGEETNI